MRGLVFNLLMTYRDVNLRQLQAVFSREDLTTGKSAIVSAVLTAGQHQY
jgi:hypothetical protein